MEYTRKKSLSFKEKYFFILNYLDTLGNASRYIIDLIIADMKRQGIYEEWKNK
ncbi:MAG: hypothetical protein AB9836_05920 [Aminipila sp.]